MFVNSTFMPVNDKFNIRENLGNINTIIFYENLLNFESLSRQLHLWLLLHVHFLSHLFAVFPPDRKSVV